MKTKIHLKTINKFTLTFFPDYHGKKSISVRDLESKGSLTTYTLSSQLIGFEELARRLNEAEVKKSPIKIEFIKKFNKKFINEIS